MTKTIKYFFLLLAFEGIGQSPAVDILKQNSDLSKEQLLSTSKPKDKKLPTGKKVENKISLVNPFVGTGGHGHTYPGASTPFGMMQLSPDTRFEGWDGCSGYHYSDSVIYGFSHTHLSGTGVPDYCDLLIVPQNTKKPKIEPGYKNKNGYGAEFAHKDEVASPGYYKVDLIKEKIQVRLTAGDHSGMHEYTFKNKKGKKYILIDLNHRDQLLECAVSETNKNTVSGYRVSNAWAKEQHFYFHLETSINYTKATFFLENGNRKLLLEFPKKTQTLLLKVGISAVDIDGAKKNLDAEMPHWDFEALKVMAEQKWTRELNKIDFYSEDKSEMSIFYTALYHSFLNPNIFNDVDGRYRGRDNQIHTLTPKERQYTVFSLWDTYRATHPLFTLVQEQRTLDFIETFLRQYQQGGDLPVWELAGNETECMIGYHSVSVISDAYLKGIRGFNAYEALNAMVATSNFDELGKKSFGTRGYISLADEPESVSKALEYAYDDYCIARMAAELQTEQHAIRPKIDSSLKYSQLADTYFNRSFNFINNFDPSTKFMRARRDGIWYAPFNPSEVNFNYTEANSWQYSLYAPHAVGALTDLFGGKDSLEIWLDRLFAAESNLEGRHQVDITGLIGQYAHGNEPSHHMAYLYNYTNAPHKTQEKVNQILHEQYSNLPDGLSGNEDCGQMSSWYVLSALGIYQIAPGNPYYEIGRPLMNEATLHFENGRQLYIQINDNSKDNPYIQKITLNGKTLNRLYLQHEEIIQGGMLEIWMGAQPNTNVNSFAHAYTMTYPPTEFMPVPYFENESRTFVGQTAIGINYTPLKNRKFEIRYTLDGSEPTLNAPRYEKPFSIDTTTTVKVVLFEQCMDSIFQSGICISNEFVERNESIQINVKTPFANQYAAGGNSALIDGVQGGNEYRTGDWQGYYGEDLVVDLEIPKGKTISEISLSTLQDRRSWIFFPSQVTFEISTDGKNFTQLPAIQSPEIADPEDKSTYKFSVLTQEKKPITHIRVRAKNFGPCPEWHLGAGNPTWLFADEIEFK
jgi:predicted alpha-1,2-mannosidase